MLVFSTEVPVRAGSTPADFFALMRRWLPSIPQSALTPELLASIGPQPEGKLSEGQESLEWLSGRQEGGILQAGLRHSRRQAAFEECSTLVFATSPTEARLSIRVSHDVQGSTLQMPPVRKPLVIRTLLDSPLGKAHDGMLMMQDRPHLLASSDVDLAAQLIRGEAGCHLPVVYASAQFGGGWLVDVQQLAQDLAGMAHVVLEPNRHFSTRLQMATQGRNVYGGSLGLYWPDGQNRRAFFLGPLFPQPDDLASALVHAIQGTLLNRRPSPRCSWTALRDAHTRNALQSLRDSGSTDLDEYIRTFDAEIAERDRQLHEAETEILRQRLALAAQAAQLGSVGGSLLNPGTEQGLYPNELQAILLDAVQDAVDRALPDSRRRHVLQSILDANPLPDHHANQHREQLKNLLRDMRGLTPAIRRGLEDMGFAISEKGKHAKLVFQGDDRYTYTLPRSGSDWRGGLNAANDIARLLF